MADRQSYADARNSTAYTLRIEATVNRHLCTSPICSIRGRIMSVCLTFSLYAVVIVFADDVTVFFDDRFRDNQVTSSLRGRSNNSVVAVFGT